MERFEWHRLDTAVLKVFSSTLSATCSCIRQHEERYHQLTPESCRRSFPLFPSSREKILSVAPLQLHVGALVKQHSSAFFHCHHQAQTQSQSQSVLHMLRLYNTWMSHY